MGSGRCVWVRLVAFVMLSNRKNVCPCRSWSNNTWISFCFLILFLCIFSTDVLSELTVLDPGFQVEEYATYQFINGRPKFIEMDSSDNLYVTHDGGNLVRITTDTNNSILASGFQNLQGIDWGGGTSYGDFLYTAEVVTKRVNKIDVNGNDSTFTTLPDDPLSVEIDRQGNYNNQMYVGTRFSSRIYSVDNTGQSSVFKDFTSVSNNGSIDISFDPTGSFQGNMYVTLNQVSDVNFQGVLSVDPLGNVSQFFPGNFFGAYLEFDSTAALNFGGDLYFGSSGSVQRINPGGIGLGFLQSNLFIKDFIFGNDGAMYVLEVDAAPDLNGFATISRVSVIPEPISLFILGAGGLLLRRRI